MWKKDTYHCYIRASALQLIDALALLWDLDYDDALTMIADHPAALETATAQGDSVLKTAFTLGWLDIESESSIIISSLVKGSSK